MRASRGMDHGFRWGMMRVLVAERAASCFLGQPPSVPPAMLVFVKASFPPIEIPLNGNHDILLFDRTAESGQITLPNRGGGSYFKSVSSTKGGSISPPNVISV